MSNLTYTALLNEGQYNQLNTGVALTSSSALTDISPGANIAGQAFLFPAAGDPSGRALQAGQQFKISASGVLTSTGGESLTLGLYYGGVAGTPLVSLMASAWNGTNVAWTWEADMRIESVGPTGTIRTSAREWGLRSAAAAYTYQNFQTVNVAAGGILTIGAQWAAASSSYSIQCTMFTVQQLNAGGA